MAKNEIIKAYWIKINKIEEKIHKLNMKGLDYTIEEPKRKSLLNNVKRLEKGEKQ